MRRCGCLAVLLLTAFGCDRDPHQGPAGNAAAPMPHRAEELSFLAMQYSKATLPYWQKVCAAFEQQNPGARIHLQVVQWDQGQTKLRTLIGAKNPPDLANIATTWLTEYADADLLEPLDARLAPDFVARFVPTTLQGATFQGSTFGLPVAVSVRALYLNQRVMENARVKKAPATWDELRATAKAATIPRDGSVGFSIPCDSEEGHAYFAYFLWGAGGDFFDHDGKLTINTPEAHKALQFLVDLVRKDKCTNPSPDTTNRDRGSQEEFKQGKVGMLITGSWFWKMLEKAGVNYEVVPIPTPSAQSKGKATMAVTDNLVVFKACKNKDLAWKFLEFLYQHPWRKEFDDAEGMLPELKSVSEEYRRMNPRWRLFIDQLDHGKFLPNHPRAQEIFLEITKAQQRAYLGEVDVPTALTDAEKRINEEILKR